MSDYRVETKRTWEKKPISHTFPLAPGVTIASCTASAVEFVPPDHEGADVSASLLVSTTAAVSGATATAMSQNGADKSRYLVKLRATMSDGSRDEAVYELIVDDDADD